VVRAKYGLENMYYSAVFIDLKVLRQVGVRQKGNMEAGDNNDLPCVAMCIFEFSGLLCI
jgi:hypothetical protein